MTDPTQRSHGHRPVSAWTRHRQRFDTSRPVAGEPAALPLTVWPCGPQALRCRTPKQPRQRVAPVGVLGPALVGRIVLAYTRPGDLVVVAAGICVARPTVEGLQRRCVALATALADAGTADLVLMTPTSPSSLAPGRVVGEFRMAGRVLRPGGLLVAVTRPGCRVDRGAVGGCRPSDVVRAAQRAGFGYLQHNVAVHAPIADHRLPPTAAWHVRPRAAADGLPVHRVLHSDVLAFAAPVSADG